MTGVRIEFSGLPPFKANPGPTRKGAKQRQQSFHESAQKALDAWRTEHDKEKGSTFPWDPMLAKISLTVAYSRIKGDNDAANIIGGISDALQGVFYANDKQIVSIAYCEKIPGGGEDLLIVEVSEFDQEAESPLTSETTSTATGETGIPEDWDQQLDEAWSLRADTPGGFIPGPKAAMDATRIIGVAKLKDSQFKSLQGLLESSHLLASRWTRKENTIFKL